MRKGKSFEDVIAWAEVDGKFAKIQVPTAFRESRPLQVMAELIELGALSEFELGKILQNGLDLYCRNQTTGSIRQVQKARESGKVSQAAKMRILAEFAGTEEFLNLLSSCNTPEDRLVALEDFAREKAKTTKLATGLVSKNDRIVADNEIYRHRRKESYLGLVRKSEDAEKVDELAIEVEMAEGTEDESLSAEDEN